MLVSRSCQMHRPVHQSPFRVENRHSPETPRAPGESHRPIDRSPGRVGASLPRRPVRGVPGALPVCVWALALTCRGAFLHADVAFGARLAVAGHLACLLLLAAGAAPAVGILSGSPCGRRYLSLGWTRGGSAGSQGRCVSPWISRSRTSLRCAGRLPRQQGAVVAAPRASRSPGSPAEREGGPGGVGCVATAAGAVGGLIHEALAELFGIEPPGSPVPDLGPWPLCLAGYFLPDRDLPVYFLDSCF